MAFETPDAKLLPAPIRDAVNAAAKARAVLMAAQDEHARTDRLAATADADYLTRVREAIDAGLAAGTVEDDRAGRHHAAEVAIVGMHAAKAAAQREWKALTLAIRENYATLVEHVDPTVEAAAREYAEAIAAVEVKRAEFGAALGIRRWVASGNRPPTMLGQDVQTEAYKPVLPSVVRLPGSKRDAGVPEAFEVLRADAGQLEVVRAQEAKSLDVAARQTAGQEYAARRRADFEAQQAKVAETRRKARDTPGA